MRTLGTRLTPVVLLFVGAASAGGQTRAVELGLDGALTVALEDPRVVAFNFPVQQFRIGFFTSPVLSVEPTLSIDYLRIGDFDATSITLGVGFLFHMTRDRTRSQTYFRPFGGFTSNSGGGASDGWAQLGLGLGIKTPFARQLATRVEGLLAHRFEAGGVTLVGILFGLSFFP